MLSNYLKSFVIFSAALLLSNMALAKPPKHLSDKTIKLNEGLGKVPENVDRSTPLKSWSIFLDSCQKKRWEIGAHILNLGGVPNKNDQSTVGEGVVRKLCQVLEVTKQLSAEGLDDSQVGPMRKLVSL